MTLLALTLPPEKALLRRAAEGDLDALESLFRGHEVALYTLARRLSTCDADAEDAVQEAFMEAGRSIGRYRGDGPLVGWLKRIVASKALMRLRKTGLRAEAPLDGAGELPAPPLSESRLDMEGALGQLGETARAVVWLHDVEGYTHDEIANLLGGTASFSKSQLARAHARLRQWLQTGDAS